MAERLHGWFPWLDCRRSARSSVGSPSTRSAIMYFCISQVPVVMVDARATMCDLPPHFLRRDHRKREERSGAAKIITTFIPQSKTLAVECACAPSGLSALQATATVAATRSSAMLTLATIRQSRATRSRRLERPRANLPALSFGKPCAKLLLGHLQSLNEVDYATGRLL